MAVRVLEIVAESCMTLSDVAWGAPCASRSFQATCTAPSAIPAPRIPCSPYHYLRMDGWCDTRSRSDAIGDLDAEDRMACVLTRRIYPDVPMRATFFGRFSEKLDFYMVSEDRYLTTYRSLRWPDTVVEYDSLNCMYVVRVGAGRKMVFCSVEEMEDARFSGELVLA